MKRARASPCKERLHGQSEEIQGKENQSQESKKSESQKSGEKDKSRRREAARQKGEEKGARPQGRAEKGRQKGGKAKKKKQTVGEGDYAASRSFDKAQSSFVKRNESKIPAMGKAAEKALEGPEGASLRAAEEAGCQEPFQPGEEAAGNETPGRENAGRFFGYFLSSGTKSSTAPLMQ